MATLQYLLDRQQHLIADSSLSTRLHNYQQLIDNSPTRESFLPSSQLGQLQTDYFATDVNIVLTNTFDANRYKLGVLGHAGKTTFVNERAAELTRTAVRGFERHVAVAGNIGPVGMSVPHADAVNCYAEQAEALARGGVDCFWLESIGSRSEAEAAIIGCEIGAPHLPIIATLSFMDGERIPHGVLPVAAAKALCSRPSILALGVDTGAGRVDVVEMVQQIACSCPTTSLAVKMELNSLSAEINDTDTDTTIDDSKSISAYCKLTKEAARAGVRIFAAGRDATPRHLAAMSDALKHPIKRKGASRQSKSDISRKI